MVTNRQKTGMLSQDKVYDLQQENSEKLSHINELKPTSYDNQGNFSWDIILGSEWHIIHIHIKIFHTENLTSVFLPTSCGNGGSFSGSGRHIINVTVFPAVLNDIRVS